MLAHPAKLWLINTDLDAADRYGTKMSPRNHNVSLAKSQHHVINPTNPRRALDDGVEHRLHVRRRAADDAEHLGRCGLMLQGFAQFCVALAEFLEQPHVLDRDDGLISEGLEKLDLLFGERPHFRAPNPDRPDRGFLREQRHGQASASGPARGCNGLTSGNSISCTATRSSNMDRPAIENGPSRRQTPSRRVDWPAQVRVTGPQRATGWTHSPSIR